MRTTKFSLISDPAVQGCYAMKQVLIRGIKKGKNLSSHIQVSLKKILHGGFWW